MSYTLLVESAVFALWAIAYLLFWIYFADDASLDEDDSADNYAAQALFVPYEEKSNGRFPYYDLSQLIRDYPDKFLLPADVMAASTQAGAALRRLCQDANETYFVTHIPCRGVDHAAGCRCCLGRNHPGLCYDEIKKRGFRRTNPYTREEIEHRERYLT